MIERVQRHFREARQSDWKPTWRSLGAVGLLSVGFLAGRVSYVPQTAYGSGEPPAGPTRPVEAAILPMLAPMGELSIFSKPTISKQHFIDMLQSKDSPLFKEGTAGEFYDYCERLGINPGVGAGFYGVETVWGKKGAAVDTKAFANIRYGDPKGYQKSLETLLQLYPQLQGKIEIIPFKKYINKDDNDTFRDYSDNPQPYLAGAKDWADEMVAYYLAWGWGYTVDQVVPDHFAPASDGNNPHGYIRGVKDISEEWRNIP